MSDQVHDDAGMWPRRCPSCGTELQSHTTGFTPRATEGSRSSEGLGTAVVAEGFCPNPDCPARQENAPGSLGGDNGGG